MHNMRKEGEVPSSTNLHPIPAFIRSSTSSFPHHYSPRRWLKNFPFPNPILALSRLSYIPPSSCRRPPHSNISAVCLCQADGQFPLLAVFPWNWNVEESWTRMAFDWKCHRWDAEHHRVAGGITSLSDLFELGWIRNASGLEKR